MTTLPSPRITYRPAYAKERASLAPMARHHAARADGPDFSLLFAGGALLFTGVLLGLGFAVHLREYLSAQAHFSANAALVAEAREAGIAAARHASLVRMFVFGPAALALTIGGLFAVFTGGGGSRD